MTKEQLAEYRDLQQEIQRLKKKLEKLKDTKQDRLTDTVRGSMTEFPYTQHPITIEGFDAQHRLQSINKLERILSGQVKRSMQKTCDIAEFICSIEPAKVRAIFEYRYYDLLPWQQIAFKLGATSEAYPRNIHDKYLNEVRFSTNET